MYGGEAMVVLFLLAAMHAAAAHSLTPRTSHDH
jgi:hypothetical protein